MEDPSGPAGMNERLLSASDGDKVDPDLTKRLNMSNKILNPDGQEDSLGRPMFDEAGASLAANAPQDRYVTPDGRVKLTTIDKLAGLVVLIMYAFFVGFQHNFSKSVKPSGNDDDDGNLRREEIFLEKFDLKVGLLIIIASFSAFFALVALVRGRNRLGRRVELRRERATRAYFVVFACLQISYILKMVWKKENPVLGIVCIMETTIVFAFGIFETSRMRMLEKEGRLGKERRHIQEDRPEIRELSDPRLDGLVKLAVVMASLLMAAYYLMQFSAFLGDIQMKNSGSGTGNLMLALLMFLGLRFRVMSFVFLIEGYELPFLSAESLFMFLAMSWQILFFIITTEYLYFHGFTFENSFQRRYLELDTAGILAMSAVSIYHAVRGFKLLSRVSQNSNYEGPSMRHRCPTIFLRYEYNTFHALAFWTLFYTCYRMFISSDGFFAEEPEYQVDEPHIIISRILMMIEVISVVVLCTLMNFLPPLSKTQVAYHEWTRFGIVVALTQFLFGIHELLAFITYLEDPSEQLSKFSVVVGFGLLPVIMFRMTAFSLFAFKFMNARRTNLFTGETHDIELFVGARNLHHNNIAQSGRDLTSSF